ncbi:MAG: hypothetical protein COZ08_08545 [Bacteroidetes bacterium CG_4_10_14_3_um_filter_42_6]|nr:MAG: hypothetical protein COZ08_08545 [Bacteroidetes bacterium CG_4_10_14_3_um_filter_42_6]
MAIVQNPITGRTKKTFGTAVFSKQFGNNTMRSKAMDVRNPRTEGQVNQRNKFSIIVDLIRQVLPLINEVYAGSLTSMSPYNKITSINVKNAFVGEPPELDHTKVVLCDFTGSTVKNVTLTGQPDQVMDIAWDPNTTNADELASLLTFVLFNCSTNEAAIFRDAAARGDGMASVTVPDEWVDAQTSLHVLTRDFSQTLAGAPKGIVKFKGGADLSSVVK